MMSTTNVFKLCFCCMILLFTACRGNSSDTYLTEDSDNTVYISDEILDENKTGDIPQSSYEIIEEEEVPNVPTFSGRLETLDSYKDYVRLDDSPEEFAKVAVWHAINMVYPEPFKSPRVDVLYTKVEGNRFLIQMKISWSDRWISPYVIEGTLVVNRDGSGGVFSITSKNLNAQSLEFTHENSTNTKQLPIL